MPKLFVVSDIHSFYDKLIETLKNAEFDENNKDHWLVCCGDYFDRGDKPLEVLNYLTGLKRKILIRGNHEDLLMDCLKRKRGLEHDFHNGTIKTINDFAPNATSFEDACEITEKLVQDFINSTVNYFETENYVYVHGWIPNREDWREASNADWDEACWSNGIKEAIEGNTIEKNIICGHYHTSWGHALKNKNNDEWGKNADFSPYYSEGIIAIDACTVVSNTMNMLVLEDEFISIPFIEKELINCI